MAGYNGIWFGVIITKVIEIALITPPLGFNAYVVHSASAKKVTLEDVFKGITPFLLLEIIALVILILFPPIITVFTRFDEIDCTVLKGEKYRV